MPILIDTNVLFASATPSDTLHARAAAAMRLLAEETILLPANILAETLGLARARHGIHHQRVLWDAVLASGIDIVPVDAELIAAAREIDRAYADTGFGFADCLLLATCERERVARVLTFDRRLAAFKPSFAPALELLP